MQSKVYKPFVKLDGFSISEGTVEGKVHILFSDPFSDKTTVDENTILVVDYPASTLVRFMNCAGGVIAESGTNRIEIASYMGRSHKPVFFGSRDLIKSLQEGENIKLVVKPDNTAVIYRVC